MANREARQPPFFVIEGSDKAGKTTQAELLQQRLEEDGYSVYPIDLPRYNHPGGYFSQRYIAGDYGGVQEVGPKLASVLFAVDRFDLRSELVAAADSGQVVVANRYVASNLAHQGAKISDPGQRKEFFDWVMDFEYGVLKIPRPTANLVLLVDAAISRHLREDQPLRSGTAIDIHESDDDHQEQSRRVYRELCRLFPEEFISIDCQDGNQLKPPEEIGHLVYGLVKARLDTSFLSQ